MIKKLIVIAAFIVVGLFAFVGCGGNKYHATVRAESYDDAVYFLDGEFLQANRTNGASYTVYEDGEYKSEYCLDENCPKERTFVIGSAKEFEDVFIVTPQEYGVDFESQMLVIYTCTAINVRQVSIKRVSYSSGSLNIKLKTKTPAHGVGDTCQPYQRYMFITMDKLDVTLVTVDYN